MSLDNEEIVNKLREYLEKESTSVSPEMDLLIKKELEKAFIEKEEFELDILPCLKNVGFLAQT